MYGKFNVSGVDAEIMKTLLIIVVRINSSGHVNQWIVLFGFED